MTDTELQNRQLFLAGWLAAAEWAGRDDLQYDVGSTAYNELVNDALAATQPAKPEPVQPVIACKQLCELCVKRGYDFCANAAVTTALPTLSQIAKPDSDHHRTLSKWLNEGQTGPIDRFALAHVLSAAAQAQPARMLTDEEVKQCYMCEMNKRVSTRLQEKFAEINGITLEGTP